MLTQLLLVTVKPARTLVRELGTWLDPRLCDHVERGLPSCDIRRSLQWWFNTVHELEAVTKKSKGEYDRKRLGGEAVRHEIAALVVLVLVGHDDKETAVPVA